MIKKTKYLFIIAFVLGSLNGISQVVKTYPYHVNPEEYPDYSRRPFATPTWETFKDTVQFVGGRVWSQKFGTIDGKAPYWLEGGTVLRPNYLDFRMSKDSLRSSLMRMKNQGLYLFNINAYGPGTPVKGGFGQFKLEPWKISMMAEILEDKYMGFDLGEQDGRYWADHRSIDFPLSSNYKERYLNAMKYMHRAAIDQGDIISQLSVKWFWHYPIKDGFITISGAESQSKTYTSNDQIHYAFLRGASKQYGLLWYGDISVFNTWGWKTYGTEKNERTSSDKGNSIAWMKRMLLSQYQYNSVILGFEGSRFYKDKTLSPIGMLQTDMQEFVKKHPKIGPQHTPVAFLQDFFSGWMTPCEPFLYKYRVWNSLPYKDGDFFSHHLLNMFYEGYDQSGLHKNEYGGLCNTPYGDALDVLLSDVRLSTLLRYQMVVVANELNYGLEEVSDKLNSYVDKGGHLVITSDNVRKVFPNIKLTNSDTSFSVDEISRGKGKITIIHGKNFAIDKNNELDNGVASSLDKLFRTTSLFSVGDSLGYVTNVEGAGKYMVGVYNHSLKSKSFKIKSHIGKIKSVKELYPIRNLTKEPGYFPEGYTDTNPGLSDEGHIAAGDVRLFLVTVDENNVNVLPEILPEKRITDKYLSMPSLIGLQDKLQTMPTFFDYFSGVKINWKELTAIDEMKFNEDAWWYNLKQLQIAVEFDKEFIEIEKTDKGILLELTKKLSALEHLDLILFSNDFDKKFKDIVTKSFEGIRVLSKSSNKILIAKEGEVAFNKQGSKLVVIDQTYSSWDKIYPVAKAMNNGTKYTMAIIDSDKKNEYKITSRVKPENKNIYFSYHDTNKDLMLVLNETPEYLENFGGVKIDGTYLFSRSIGQCKKESELIKNSGLDIVIDLNREINNYPNLTWLSELEHAYKRSTDIHENILAKMEVMGIVNIIIGSHMRPEMWQPKFGRTPEESITSGMSEFIEKANKRGITVSIQNRMYKQYPSRLLAKPTEVSTLISNFRKEGMDVKYTAHFGLGEKPKKLFSAAGKDLNICILASMGSRRYDYRIPFSLDQGIDFTIDKNVLVVLDADYQSVNELIENKDLFQKKVN